jgi:hypothetical protein
MVEDKRLDSIWSGTRFGWRPISILAESRTFPDVASVDLTYDAPGVLYLLGGLYQLIVDYGTRIHELDRYPNKRSSIASNAGDGCCVSAGIRSLSSYHHHLRNFPRADWTIRFSSPLVGSVIRVPSQRR